MFFTCDGCDLLCMTLAALRLWAFSSFFSDFSRVAGDSPRLPLRGEAGGGGEGELCLPGRPPPPPPPPPSPTDEPLPPSALRTSITAG